MLPRVLEPEVMDSVDDAAAYDAMDHEATNRQFVDDLLRAGLLDGALRRPAAAVDTGGNDPRELLDVGAGPARLAIELCRRDERIRILAADLSDSMLRLARINVEVAGLADRILLDRADAGRLPYDDDRFAAVLSNSLVHHLPEPGPALKELSRVVAPGGLIFVRDLLRPPDDAAVKRLVRQYGGNATEHQQALLDASLRASLGLEEIRGLVGTLGFDRRGVTTTSDRHWTWVARKPIAGKARRE